MLTVGSLALLYFAWKCLSKNNLIEVYKLFFSLTIIVELLIERGYFIQLGSIQIAYRTVCELVLFILSVILCTKNKAKKYIFSTTSILFIIVLIGIILLIVFPTKATGATMEISWDDILMNKAPKQNIIFNTGMYTELMQLMFYLVIIITAVSLFCKDDYIYILEKVVLYSKPIMYINCLEILTKYIFHSNIYTSILNMILGNSYATTSQLEYRGNGFVLSGFNKEASHYAYSLLILFLLAFCYYICLEKKIDLKYIIIVAINFLLTMSFSTIYFGACAILFVLIYYWQRRGYSTIKLSVFISIFVIGIYALFYFLPAISGAIGSTGFFGRRVSSVLEELSLLSNGKWLRATTALEWSNRVRLGSTYETFKLIVYRPLLGLGFSAASAHSSFAMLLSGVGIIGTFSYLKVIFGWENKIIKFNKSIYISFIFIFIFSLLLNSLGLRPFYEVWNILLAFSFAFLASKGRK